MTTRVLAAVAVLAGSVGSAHALVIFSEGFERVNGFRVGQSGDSFAWSGTGAGGSAYLDVDAGSANAGLFSANGWTVTGTTNSTGIDLVKDPWSGTPNSPNGDQWVDVAGSPGPGGLNRLISLTANTPYRLTFQSFRNSGNTLNVTFGGQSATLSTTLTAQWATYTVWFTPSTTALYTLGFATPQSGSGNIGLDNIQVDAVPEPFTLALGAAGLAAAARRRRARK